MLISLRFVYNCMQLVYNLLLCLHNLQLAIKAGLSQRRHHHQLMTPNKGQGRMVLVFLLLVAGAGVVAMALAGKPLGKLRGPLLGERVNLKVLVAGALYALGAAGCTLPTFVVFLAYSALVGPEGSVPLMAAYSAGMLVPVGALVVALSAFGRRALERFSALARHAGLLGRTVLLAAGLYMVYVWFSLGVVPLSA
jgi:cytochrome c biogenesis protein CcdA